MITHSTPPPFPLKFPLIVLLISLSLLHFKPSLDSTLRTIPQTLTLTGNLNNGTASKNNYIVRFTQYKPAHHHRSYLKSRVKSDGWEWIERRNPAAKFPTDFGLVAIDELETDGLIEEIMRLPLVKDVNVDSSYKRALLNDGDGGGGGVGQGAFVDGKKRPGKIFTSMSFSDGDYYEALMSNSSINWGRHLLMQRSQVTSLFGANALWSKGYTGAKVKMAIFDTGIRANHPHFRNIKERTNWTNEDTLNDNLGHGTFVAGVIAGEDAECLGFAPDTEIYAFRVFTDAQVSYTSWFLDAFNYAIATNMDVLNLSIGGPDYMDLPFVEKVWEITANNIIMVSAIGNDGPLYGTLNNPADQSDVIGVGGIDYSDHIASFSSRGMSTWEIPHGYGRVKPDVVAYGREIMGSKISTGCKSLSGTSVASPVVAGVVCLLVSVIPESNRKDILNPASMKQALVEGAAKLSGPNMYEQGAGRVDLLESYDILKSYQPRASIFPGVLDYTECPYSWPFCRQPLYAGAMPVIFNATILNGMGVIGYVESPPTWHPSNEEGNLLSIHFTYSEVIWPWTGYLALHMQIKEEGAVFSGEIGGNVTLRVRSPPTQGEKGHRSTTCVLQLRLKVVPTPPRSKRVLWDQFHNIKYPPGYIPRDSLDVRNDILDWHGDHLHTNFHIMFNMLRDAGYYVETLGSPFTCFDANQYGTLLLVDLEDEYFQEEIEKLRDDVVNTGLGLAVFAEWYNVDTMVKMRFFDDNTRSWWTPVTGGANVPALNDLLAPFGIAFGDKILNGDFSIAGEQSRYASGTDIVRFPGGGYVHGFPLMDSSESGATQNVLLSSGASKADSPILGLLEVGEGRIAVYGDSNCLDSSHMVTNCYWLLKKILDFTSVNIRDPVLFSSSVKQHAPLYVDDNQLPSRRTDINFSAYSAVVGKDLICKGDSRFEVWGTKGYNLQVRGRNRRLPGYPVIDLGRGLNSSVDTSKGRRPPERERLTQILNTHLNNIHETFQILDQSPPSNLKKVSWNDVVQMGDQVSKQATIAGMLWNGEVPTAKALEENMESYFNLLQGFLLLAHGSTIGAGTTLSSSIHASAKQVVDCSFKLLKESVSLYAGSRSKDQKLSITQLVGSVWEACSALKKVPSSNVMAIGRAMSQVAVSVKDVLREMKELKPGSSVRIEESSDDATTKASNDDDGNDDDSNEDDLGNDLSPEEMKVAQSAIVVVSETLIVMKELIRTLTGCLKLESSSNSSTLVDSLEKLLKLCQGIGVQIDELGACLYPPQEVSAIKVASEKIFNIVEELLIEVESLESSSGAFCQACSSLRSSLKQMESELDSSNTTDFVAEMEKVTVSN